MTGKCEQSQIHTHICIKNMSGNGWCMVYYWYNASSGCSVGVFIILPLVISGWWLWNLLSGIQCIVTKSSLYVTC